MGSAIGSSELARRLRAATRAKSGEAIREEVHAALRDATGADWVGSWAADTRPDGASTFVGLEAVSSPARVDRTVGLVEGAVAPAGSALSPPQPYHRRRCQVDHPDAQLVNRFTRLDRDIDRRLLGQTAIGRRFYAPLEVADQLRILVYAGPRFVRWLGCLHMGDPRARFSRRRAAAVARASDRVAGALVEADAMERAALGRGRHVGVLDARTRLESATDTLERWLTRDRRADALARIVTGCDPEEGPSSLRGWMDGWRLELTRMGGPAGPRWLVEATPPERILLRPTSTLSRRQLEIGEMLVVGATYPEIALHLGISVNTVKYHVSALYDALDVASRAELARRWADSTR